MTIFLKEPHFQSIYQHLYMYYSKPSFAALIRLFYLSKISNLNFITYAYFILFTYITVTYRLRLTRLLDNKCLIFTYRL